MKPYLYETHLHTSEMSHCATSTYKEQLDGCKKYGLAGVFVTNHFFTNGSSPYCNKPDIPWEEKVNGYCDVYDKAREYGETIGLSVFFGFEYSLPHCGNDFLVYGIDRAWLLAHPEMLELSVNDLFDLLRNDGGVIIHAHPFREAQYIDMIRLLPCKTDGVEIYNANRTDFENEMARRYCESYDFIPFAGSDCHNVAQVKRGCIGSDEKLSSIDDFLTAFRARKLSVEPLVVNP